MFSEYYESPVSDFFLSWNLRNLLDKSSFLGDDKFRLIEIQPGEYPIDGWKPHYLELPKDGKKMDVSGRMNNVFSVVKTDTVCDPRRIIRLPIYTNDEHVNIGTIKQIIESWEDFLIPEDIPCFAIAFKCYGNYTDFREAQYISVLLIWNDEVCRIISLDWFEGPEEDCITPEWYVTSSPLLNLDEGIAEIEAFNRKSGWTNPVYSIFVLPSCLGYDLKGEVCEEAYRQWGQEWKYTDFSDLRDDIELICSNIKDIFS